MGQPRRELKRGQSTVRGGSGENPDGLLLSSSPLSLPSSPPPFLLPPSFLNPASPSPSSVPPLSRHPCLPYRMDCSLNLLLKSRTLAVLSFVLSFSHVVCLRPVHYLGESWVSFVRRLFSEEASSVIGGRQRTQSLPTRSSAPRDRSHEGQWCGLSEGQQEKPAGGGDWSRGTLCNPLLVPGGAAPQRSKCPGSRGPGSSESLSAPGDHCSACLFAFSVSPCFLHG